MFEEPTRLLLGLVTGFAFGWLLQKGQVSKYRVILGQMLLKDFTMLKVMLTAIVVGGIGVYALIAMDLAALHVKPMLLGGVVVGGLVFGVGMSLLGYCPGTSVAAIGEGSRHAIWGTLGMLFGAAVYAEAFPYLGGFLSVGDFGKGTLATALGISPWVVLAALTVATVAIFVALEKSGPQPAKQPAITSSKQAPTS